MKDFAYFAPTTLAEAVALLETQPPGPELAMAYSNLSHLAMLADRFDDALALGKSAIAIGEVMGRMDPAGANKLLIETGKDFTRAGEATRTVIQLVTAP